jgi:hypothetical protein
MSDQSVHKFGRRRTLQILGVGGLTAGGVFSVAGCGSDEEKKGGADKGQKQAAAGKGCDAPITPQSQQLRKSLQYVDQSPHPEKNCANCAQYLADKFGECGGCNLIPGPVQAKGYCLSWAAKGSGGGSGGGGGAATKKKAG